MVVVFPAPAGPTSRSISRPEVAIEARASAWLRVSSWPWWRLRTDRSIVAALSAGAVRVSARSRRRRSAAMTAAEEYLEACRGRKTEVPSSR